MSNAKTLVRILERLAAIEARLATIEARVNRPEVIPFFYPVAPVAPQETWKEPWKITWTCGDSIKVT